MSTRLSFALAALLLLLAAGLRLAQFATLPPGLHAEEITDIRVTETVRTGQIEVFYDLGGGHGREPLYHVILAAVTGVIGSGLLGFHLLSSWAGMLTLAAVYALVSRLYSPLAGAAALALLAVNFWHILLSREVAREALLPLLTVGALLALTLALRVHRPAVVYDRWPPTTPFAALGVLLGLGVYAHPVMLLVALASMVFIAYMLLTRQPLTRRTLAYLGFSILILIIFAMPYVISSIRLPHLAGSSRLLGAYTAEQLAPLKALVDGLTGLFFQGDQNPVRNLPGRPLVDLVSGLLILVGLLTAIRHWRQPRYMLALIAMFTLFPAAFLAEGSPNFLAMTPLLPLLALFGGLGVNALHRSLESGTRPFAAVGLLGLLAFNLIWTGRDLFQRWPELPAVYTAYHGRLGQLAHHIDVTAGDTPTLICDTPAPPDSALTDTDRLLLMLNRPDAPLRYADCGTGLVLMQGGAPQQIIFPQPGMLDNVHPYLKTWTAHGTLLTRPDLPADGVLTLAVERELADKVGRFTTTAPVAFAPEAPAVAGSSGPAAPPVRFGGNLTLLGYEPPPTSTYLPGGIVTSITYWRADGPLPPDLRLFTHILPDPASIAAQNDTLSVRASALHNRDIFIQVMFVPLPPSIPDGVYSLSVGAYQDSTQTRLPVYDGDHERGTRLFMGTITVTHMASG